MILKTSKSTESLTQPEKGGVGIDSDSRAERDGSELIGSEIDSNEVGDDEVGKKVQKPFRFKNLSKSKKLLKFKKTIESDLFTPRARLAFIILRQAFVKALILHQFDLKHHI